MQGQWTCFGSTNQDHHRTLGKGTCHMAPDLMLLVGSADMPIRESLAWFSKLENYAPD
jgi:hypothetical protein